MSNPSISLRLPPGELRSLEQAAAGLGMSKSEYLRLALGVTIRQEKIEEKLVAELDGIHEQIANFQAREAKLFKLLLRVQNAPESALSALEKIVELHAGSGGEE